MKQSLLSVIFSIMITLTVCSGEIPTAPPDSTGWVIGKRPYIVPIPGTRTHERMQENSDSADVILTEQEISEIDTALEQMEISEVFGGSRITKQKEDDNQDFP